MGVNLIFRIAAVGILVSVICRVLSTAAGMSRLSLRVWPDWCWYYSG